MKPVTRPVAILLLLICTMLWGFAFVAQKSAMASMGPLTFAAIRYLLGGIVILPLALWEYRRVAQPISAEGWGLVGLLSFVFFCGSYLQQAGLLTTTVTNGGFLTGLYVLFVPLLAFILLRSRPHPVVILCVPLALVGLFFLKGARLDGLNRGDGLIVGSAGFWAVHVLMLGHVARTTGMPIFISGITFVAAGAIALVLALIFENPTLAGIGAGWVEILYAGVLSTAVAFTLQAIGQRHVPAANAAIILSSEILFAALGGALLLGERLTPVGYTGAALMFLAILLVELVPALVERRRARAALVPGKIVN